MTLADYEEPRPTNQWIELMQPAGELAAQIAQTDFVPAEFKNKPAQIAACILYGAELGLGPMVSLTKIDIVKGRPAPRAELGRALALAAGHECWVEESTNTRVAVAGKRKGSSHVHTVTWTMDDAKKAGIAGNPSYAKYPRQMLLARASAELIRQMAPEVLGGITVFAEEAQDIDDDAPIVIAEAKPTTTKRSRKREPEPEPIEDAEIVAEAPATPDKPSDAQTRMAMAAFNEQGIEDRDDRLNATSAILGRPVASWNDLNRDEASRVIDGLERLKGGNVAFRIDDNGAWHIEATTDDTLAEA